MLKENVLRHKKEFAVLYGRGKSIPERCLVLIYIKNHLPIKRRAFLASKKVGGAVQRNRARRLLKESYRSIEENIVEGYDFVWIARRNIVQLKCADVKKAMEAALKKAGLIKKSNG